MSCDHKLITEHGYAYVTGTLSAHLRSQCETQLNQCEHCQRTLANMQELHHLATDWEDQAVPEWSHARHIVRPGIRQSHWQSRAAFACSLLAVLLVVFRFEIRIDDGLTISFGGNQQQNQLETLLAQELRNFAQQQNQVLDERLDDYMEFQNLNNQVVLNDWLELNRQERETDLNFLLSGWQSQRLQDSQRINQQLDILTENQLDNNAYLNQIIRNVGLNSRGNL